MRIGHFVSLGIGGADRAAFNLLCGMKRIGVHPIIFYSRESLPMRTEDQDESQPLLDIKSSYENNFELIEISQVADLLNYKLDILHTHRSGEDEWLLPNLSKMQTMFKIVETNFHGYLSTPANFRIYPSHELMRFKKIAISENNTVIPNPIRLSPDGINLRNKLGIAPESIVLGRIGRSDNSIYSPSLLRMFKALSLSHNLTLLWVGASAKSRSDAKKLDLNNVIWINPTADSAEIASYYETFDIYCHFNALGETFGNTVAEAMLAGLPVVSLRGSRRYPQAQKELLGETGQFFTSRRKAKKRLQELITSKDLRSELGVFNLSVAKTEFEPEYVARKVLRIYQRLALS